MVRNGKIEFLRWMFTFAVLLVHAAYVSNGKEIKYFRGGMDRSRVLFYT